MGKFNGLLMVQHELCHELCLNKKPYAPLTTYVNRQLIAAALPL